MLKLIVVALIVAAAVGVYKLWKAKKAFTAGNVVAEVKTEVVQAATEVKDEVSK